VTQTPIALSASELATRLEGGLIVSCQPVTGGPLDTTEAIMRFALAAEAGGAAALRIEGAANVAAVTGVCGLPVIGIVKRDLAHSPVRITPHIEDVDALAAAGAAIIAIDATDRDRPVPAIDLLARIHAHGRLAMADLSNRAEADAARGAGFDILGTTLSGYTGGPVPADPDLDLVSACARLGVPLVAEGRYNTPELVARARRAGATAVCVGSAITRTEHVVQWFGAALASARVDGNAPVLAIDIGGTKTLVAIVRDGVILERRQCPTSGAIGSARWFDDICDLVAPWQRRGRRHRRRARWLVVRPQPHDPCDPGRCAHPASAGGASWRPRSRHQRRPGGGLGRILLWRGAGPQHGVRHHILGDRRRHRA
jgi:N-acetylmannosamine-6-phosphate 2-epimerase / N-acetylmannosamine kinase